MRTLFAVASAFLVASSYGALDLDWKTAKSNYDAQQVVVDRAKSKLDNYNNYYNGLQSRLYSALQTEKSAQDDLDRAESALQQINSDITSLENTVPGIQQQIQSLEGDKRRAEDDVQDAQRKLRQAQQDKNRLEDQLRNVQSQLAAEKGKPTPDAAKVSQLESQVSNLQSQIGSAQNQCQRWEREVRDGQDKIRRIEDDIRNAQFQITTNQNKISQLNRQRDDQLRVVDNCRTDLRTAQEDVRRAQSDVDAAARELAFLQSDYDSGAQQAQRLYAYYQQVVANYNSERDKVIRLAEAASAQHGGAEASERAPEPGSAAGKASAQKEGVQAGEGEASTIQLNRGYREGRASAATLPALATFYKDGLGRGADTADRKAVKEDFPRGYNTVLAELLQKVPGNDALMDISDQIPADPGDAGQPISSVAKVPGSEAAPTFSGPIDPAYQPPVAHAPSVPGIERDNRYFNPPCAGLVLAEFEPLCRERYDANYEASFQSAYLAYYTKAFKETYGASVKDAYDQGLAKAFPQSYQAGLKNGAGDQGVLDGFEKRLPAARDAQYAAGQAACRDVFAQGYLVVARSAALEETSGDGLFTPGEKIKLALVLDNLGGKRIPLNQLRVRVTGSVGLETVSANVRELPALDGDTRTKLVGVVSATVSSAAAGKELSLSLVTELKTATGEYVKVAEAQAKQVVHYPVELESLTLPKKPKVNETVNATLKYHNLTRDAVPELKAKLTVSPAIVDAPKEVVVPALAAGEAKEVAIAIKPGVWVGDAVQVPLVSHLTGLATELVQPFPTVLNLDRSASIVLLDAAGAPMTTDTFVVNAGSRMYLTAKVKFLKTQWVPGPFVLAVGKSSDAGISSSSGSTVSIDYGGIGPTTTLNPQRFYFDIAPSLKGKTGYVLISLAEGGVYSHVQQVFLQIK